MEGKPTTLPWRHGDSPLRKNVCPVCAASPMDMFFGMASVPLYCNVLWPTQEAALRCPKGDIELAFCQACGFVANLAFEPERLAYSQDYENSLHFSPRFQAYARELASHLINRYQLNGKDIIEIGCGKGEFLAILCQLGGNRGIGFDRSHVDGRVDSAVGGGIRFVKDFYSECYSDYACDFIVCRHTLEHIHQPTAFLTSLRRTIGSRRNTAVFFEVPDVTFSLRDMSIWDIIYEHCSYFCPQSLLRLFTSCGFHVGEIKNTFEGQFLCIEALPSDGRTELYASSQNGLEQMVRDVAAFGNKFSAKQEKWNRTLENINQSDKRTIVWGAGSKGVTFLNTVKAVGQLEYVVDVNPHKQGMHIPGTGQKVVPPEFLRAYRPDVVIVMNYIYRDEIAQSMESLGLAPELMTV